MGSPLIPAENGRLRSYAEAIILSKLLAVLVSEL